MARYELTADDVQVAKDSVIQLLTNALLRAEAESAMHRRERDEGEPDGGNGPVTAL